MASQTITYASAGLSCAKPTVSASGVNVNMARDTPDNSKDSLLWRAGGPKIEDTMRSEYSMGSLSANRDILRCM